MTTPPEPTIYSRLSDAHAALSDVGELADQLSQKLRTTQSELINTQAQRDVLAQQVAELRAQLGATSRPPMPAGWSQVVFYDDFREGLDPAVWIVADGAAYARDTAYLMRSQVRAGSGGLTIVARNVTPSAATKWRAVASGEVRLTPAKRWRGTYRWEVCAALPTAEALWSAGWLRDWPSPGEIDVFEAAGPRSPIVLNVHENTDGKLPDGTLTDHVGKDWKPPAGWRRSDFHIYAVEWSAETGFVTWLIDDQVVHAANPGKVAYPSGKPATWLTGPSFDAPMGLLLNLQVGGRFPASYGSGTVNPAQLDGTAQAQLRVKWVRVLAP